MKALTLMGIACAATLGCSLPATDATVTQPLLPDRTSFPYVAALLEHRCGTLDCHGLVYRNLRIFGNEGVRYSASDFPCIPKETTAAEIHQDYGSVVGLQPEVMNDVMVDRGADPERLDLLAKPLGLEAHKGLTLITKGDPQYVCITSWLAGQTDTAACLETLPKTICSIPKASLFDGGAGP